jgi:hypothetical protein
MNASVTLKEKITVSVTPQKTKELFSMGAGGSVAKKFFKAVGENLKQMPPETNEAKK